jgi:GT2 family glycosyltransferase
MEQIWLVVAVCTNRRPHQVAPGLTALAAQLRRVEGTAGLLVVSGPTATHEELEELAERNGVGSVRCEDPGVAAARNAAVHASAAKVIAFIDDDAIPEEGWLESLAAHWREAPPGLACVGGAIDPLWLDPPPRWMSPRVHIVFSLLDRGEGVVPLVPGREDAWSANASFLRTALVEVGGFDPTLGPLDGIPFFGEDTEVQCRLAAAGYHGIYAGDVRVRHAVSAERMRLREVFRRRFYGGASMACTGQWKARDGLVRLAAGLLEIPVSLLTRRSDRLAGGIARAGAGAGALAAPLVRARLARRRARR